MDSIGVDDVHVTGEEAREEIFQALKVQMKRTYGVNASAKKISVVAVSKFFGVDADVTGCGMKRYFKRLDFADTVARVALSTNEAKRKVKTALGDELFLLYYGPTGHFCDIEDTIVDQVFDPFVRSKDGDCVRSYIAKANFRDLVTSLHTDEESVAASC